MRAKARSMDSEIKLRNYERELELCQKSGGDIEKYRRLNFNVYQLEQIRLGLEHGIDPESYVDPSLSWIEMECAREAAESGFDMSSYRRQGFSWLQCGEIFEGKKEGLDVSVYAKIEFLDDQMREIRKGMKCGIDVSLYAKKEFEAVRMREIRRGLEAGLDVSLYAKDEFKFLVMRALRKGLEKGYDLTKYGEKGYGGKELMELIRGYDNKNQDIQHYFEQGYTAEQLEQLNNAYDAGVNLLPYFKPDLYGAQLEQIVKGLKKGLDVSVYAKPKYNWFQMREIRFGLEDKIDVTPYANPSFSYRQMIEIRNGILAGVDVSKYAKVYFEPEEMQRICQEMQKAEPGVELERLLNRGVDTSVRLAGEPGTMGKAVDSKKAKAAEKAPEVSKTPKPAGTSKSEGTPKTPETLKASGTPKVKESSKEPGAPKTPETPKASGTPKAPAAPKPTEEKPENTVQMAEIADEGLPLMPEPWVEITEDKMKVYLNLPSKGGPYTLFDLEKMLRNSGVKQGIHKAALKDIVNKKLYDQSVLVAEGKPSVQGKDGKFKFHFRRETNHRPKVLENGMVDYKSMELFETVKKDQLLVEYEPPTAGEFGYDVTGKFIIAQKGKELPPLHGEGFFMSEDRRQYFSLLDGVVELENDDKLVVKNMLVISSDVDNSTGNIDFDGDVNIMGSVTTGFRVEATGNVVIEGRCEGCTIKAGKDVLVRKGCQGQEIGRIEAGGSVTGQFFESTEIRAEEDVEVSYLLNCQVSTIGKLKVQGRRGVIIGGYVRAKQGVECFGIGTVAEVKTVLEVGIDKDDMTNYQELAKAIQKVKTEIEAMEDGVKKLMGIPDKDEEKQKFFDRLTKGLYSKKTELKEMNEQKNDMLELMTKQRGASISVTGRVYPGTILYINSEPYVVSEESINVRYVKQESGIVAS